MAHTTIVSDLRGSLFAIDHDGDVFRNWHANTDGTGPLVHPGVGEKIASGWSGVRHLAVVMVGNTTCLAGIGPEGQLVAAPTGLTMARTSAKHTVPTPVPGAPSGIRVVFGGANGALYTVTRTGALVQQKLTVARNVVKAGPAKVVGPKGWGDGFTLFTNGDGIFFEVTLSGALRYRHVGTGKARNTKWVTLAAGWSRHHEVFGGGPGVIYSIGSEGSLERRTYSVSSSEKVQLDPRTSSSKVGSGLFPWTGLAANIEGYAWPMSLREGDTVDIQVGVRVSTPPVGVPHTVSDPVTYTVEFRRLRRWHKGKEADYDDVMPTSHTGQQFTAARYAVPNDVLAGAGWKKSLSLKVPDLPAADRASWRPGVYAARLIDAEGRSFYAPFIVRPKSPRSPFAVLANTNTWNTYNSWGGRGKYTHTYPLPGNLPFQRPHPGLTPDVFFATPEKQFTPYGPSVYMNTCHLLRAELWVLGWLEDLGSKYAYDVYTDQDMHDGNTGIGEGHKPAYKGVILNTHPEYWTTKAYDRLRAYRDQGGSIIYLGGNGIYEAVELSPDGAHMKIFPGIDLSRYPSYINNEQIRLTCLMRAPMNSRPEHALIGVGFQHCAQANAQGQTYNLQQDPRAKGANPVLAGLKIKLNAPLGATSHDVPAPWMTPHSAYHSDGWEVDQRGAGTPPEGWTTEALIGLGNSDPSLSGEMLSYVTEQGGVVFAASSINFGGSMVVDPNMQLMVRNALDMCLER